MTTPHEKALDEGAMAIKLLIDRPDNYGETRYDDMASECVYAYHAALIAELGGEEGIVERMAEAIHNAKIESCYMKGVWESQKAKEPWHKKNSASPDQPWHDIARDQAQAALKASGLLP